MTQPMYDLILVCNIMREFASVLIFWTKDIAIDDIILPMRDINSMTKLKIKKAWAVNNSVAYEPSSKQEVTEQLVHILDA